jgi:hypothetical protein
MNTRIESLGHLETACWHELQRAAVDKHHAWRTMVMATRFTAAEGEADGDGADARVIVLRDTQIDARTLLFYTDERSGKVAQLRTAPIVTLVAWSPRLSWQLRLRAEVAVETDGLDVSSRWARLKFSPAAQDYLSPLAPGTPVTERWEPDRAERSHFAVLRARVRSLDWLELHAEGHRRARFDADGAHWLAP